MVQFSEKAPAWALELPTLHFDGAVPFDKDIGAYGWVLKENGELIKRGWGVFKRSNAEVAPHYAEFVAVIKAMRAVQDLGYDQIIIKGDNAAVMYALQQPADWEDNRLQQAADIARRLFHSFPSARRAEEIDRAKNAEADRIAKLAISMYDKGHETPEYDPIASESEHEVVEKNTGTSAPIHL